MPLGKSSLRRLATCHPELQPVIFKAAEGIDEGDLAYAGIRDMTVLCGHRGEAEQNAAVARGASKTPWPRSGHNKLPSDAVDVAPYPVDWSDARAFEVLHAYIAGIAHAMGVDLLDISWDRPHVHRNAK